MDIIKSATAGTMESSDAYVEIEPSNGKNEVDVESIVWMQFGDKIRNAAEDVLNEMEVKNAKIRIVDRGALECVIRARVETAVMRGKGEE